MTAGRSVIVENNYGYQDPLGPDAGAVTKPGFARVDVKKNGKHVALLRPSRNYYPAQDLSMGTLGRFFRGESTSEVGLRSGLTRDGRVASFNNPSIPLAI